MPVRASATTGNYMDGIVTAYSGTSLTVNFTAATGSGTFTSWQIFLTIPGSNVTLGSNTFTGDQFVPDEAYDATGWNGDLSVPTKNAIRDKIEAITLALKNASNDATFSSTSSIDAASPEWVIGRIAKTVVGISQTRQAAEATNTGATFTDGAPKYRASGSTYTNTTSKPINIFIRASSNGSGIFYINGSAKITSASTEFLTVSTIILPGETYSFSVAWSVWDEVR